MSRSPAYRAPWWLPGGHPQTLYAALVGTPRAEWNRQRWDTPDGDFIDVDRLPGKPGAPLVALFHGLEGGSGSHYAGALARELARRGWRGAVAHFRGCSGEPNRLPRAYHSGDADEIRWILRRLRAEAHAAPLFAVGVSLGGNALLKWLGEDREAKAILAAAAAVSAPVDLMAAGDELGRGFNLVYTRAFLRTMKEKGEQKLERFPGLFDGDAMRRARTLREFDDVVTAPLHGFRDTDDYWTRSSAKPVLARIEVPTLLLNARNDPFLPAAALPRPDEVSSVVRREFPEEGGHAAFVTGPFPGNLDWLPRRVTDFFDEAAAGREAGSPACANGIMAARNASAMNFPPPEIFKAYDIRGIVGKTLTREGVRLIGQALGSELLARNRARGRPEIAVGRDGRLSGPELAGALMAGIRASGVDVAEIGMFATPVAYFAAHELGCGSAVAVTGSHNPPEYNGLKMVLAGTTLAGEDVQRLRRRIESGELARGSGRHRRAEIREAYLKRIASDVRLARPMKIAIDCGNGVAGATAGELYRRLGCEVLELYCEVDGRFPNHHPDPSRPENLKDLIALVKKERAEIGFAFDGDGDRLGVVTAEGRVIYPDRQLMLFAQDVLSRRPGAEIIYDVKSTRKLAPWIREHGGVPSLWKTGHSLIKARMRERGAELAGEMSGHVFFVERWYGFDDAQYAGARLLEILSKTADATATLDALPDSLSTPELHLKLAEGEAHRLIEALQKSASFPGATEVIRLDGLRVEYPDGFGLARASNTTPVIVLRFEADDEAGLDRIKSEFRRVLLAVKPDARLPF